MSGLAGLAVSLYNTNRTNSANLKNYPTNLEQNKRAVVYFKEKLPILTFGYPYPYLATLLKH